MKMLFLTAHLPFPPTSGGRRREFELVSRLGKKFDIYLCSLTTARDKDNLYTKHLIPYCTTVNLFEASMPPSSIQLDCKYPWLMRTYYSEEGINRIFALLNDQDFDIVHIEGYYLMQLLPQNLNVPILLVEHNIEYLLDFQRFLLSSSIEDKFYHWQEYFYTFSWERSSWKRATKVITLTTEDKSSISRLEPDIDVRVIPNGIDHEIAINESNQLFNTSILDAVHLDIINDDNPAILFVCNFLYDPNIDAALFFCKQIYPIILRDVPSARVFLVGNSPPPEILELGIKSDKQIEVTGYVDSLYPFYRAAKVVVCPLRIGGGMKVKVLEALKAGKAIVTTSIGAQGLDVDNQALCVSDNTFDFARNVVRFLVNPHERLIQEQEALRFAKTIPTWDQVKEEFARCYNEVVFNGKTDDGSD